MSDELDLPDLSEDEARRLTDRIKSRVVELLPMLKAALERRAWAALGYESWDDYCDQELRGLRLPAGERQEAVLGLAADGWSKRAIGSALGVDEKTVRNDLRGAEFSAPETVLGADGKSYPAAKPATDPLATFPAAQDAIAAALANRSTPADQPEEDHRAGSPGEDGAALGTAMPSGQTGAGNPGSPSTAQPPADDVSNDVGSDETAPKDEAPRQSSGPVELPQEQPATGVSAPAPAGDPERSGGSEEQGQAAVSVPAPPDLEKARRSEALAKWALNTPEGRAQAKRALVNEWISSTWEFLDEVGPDVFVQVADAGMHEDMDRLITAVTGWVAAKKANSGIRLVKGA